jgi:hypothetical protein
MSFQVQSWGVSMWPQQYVMEYEEIIAAIEIRGVEIPKR